MAKLGPSCNKQETITSMIDNGVDIFRLNFSHGTLEEHAQLIEILNTVRSQHSHITALMCDLCGPNIRVGNINSDGEILGVGAQVSITYGEELGNTSSFSTNYEPLVQDVEVGQPVIIDVADCSTSNQ